MKKILVVDDDPLMQKMVSALMAKEEYRVETANNGVEGLSKFKHFKPDVIISDVLMPEMDGYEFCSKIRELPDGRQIPLLMLTSLDSVEQKIKGFEVGADDYIVKPFEPREFQARVAIMVKRGELIKQVRVAERVSRKIYRSIFAAGRSRGFDDCYKCSGWPFSDLGLSHPPCGYGHDGWANRLVSKSSLKKHLGRDCQIPQ